jgi:hypothetical protein
VTEQTGQRGEAETGTSSTDTRAETSQDEADEMAGPDEQSGYEGDSGSSSGSNGDSGSSDSGSSDSSSSDSSSSDSSTSDSSDSDSSSASQDSGSSDASQGSESSDEQSSQESGQQDQQQSQQNGQQQQSQQDQQQQDQQQGEDEGDAPHGRERRSPINLGETAWKAANVLATVVRIVGYAFAAILVAYIVLALVGVNTANGVAQVIGSIGDTVVLGFRDLFLLSDPVTTIMVGFGLAAVFWVLVAEFGSRLVRWLGARLA